MCAFHPHERLAVRLGGIQNFKDHPWYEGFEWPKFYNFSMKVPYLPEIKNKKELSNFIVDMDDLPPDIEYKDDGTGWDKGFASKTKEVTKKATE